MGLMRSAPAPAPCGIASTKLISAMEFQALQFRLADMATDLTAARLLLYDAAAAYDSGHAETTMRCAMASASSLILVSMSPTRHCSCMEAMVT
jgi:alkylation response protein AidB-like acyl-CoA dehydrogenase